MAIFADCFLIDVQTSRAGRSSTAGEHSSRWRAVPALHPERELTANPCSRLKSLLHGDVHPVKEYLRSFALFAANAFQYGSAATGRRLGVKI